MSRSRQYMNYLRKHQRSRLVDDLQSEEDAQRAYQSIISTHKRWEITSSDSGDDHHQYRRKEYCLVKVIYRNPYNQRRRKLDEITIIQHYRVVFRGCLKDGDPLTFKSQRYRNESKLRYQFYINDLLEEEKIACCEHGLMDRNRPTHLFQIEKVVGAKLCYDCQFDDGSSETSTHDCEENSLQKRRILPSLNRSSSVVSEAQSSEEKQSALSIPQINNNEIASEGFSTELSDYHTQSQHQHQSDEDPTDVVPSIHSPAPKRTYGPPQLSVTESLDPISPNIRESISTELLFNSGASQLNQTQSQPSTTIETNQTEQATALSSNDIAMANDVIQLILSRLGLARQEQVDRSVATHVIQPRVKGNVESFILVYLHPSYPEESAITRLRALVNFIKIFDDTDDGIAFINTIVNEKILLILSHSLYREIRPKIEQLTQIFNIYIQVENNEQLDFPAGKSKVQGFYPTIDEISEQISIDLKRVNRDLVIYLNIASNGTSIDQIIVYFLLLSEILLDPRDMKNDRKELIYFSRQEYDGNQEELQIIDEFESKYQKDQAIYWFSRPCFLSKMLHKALRVGQPDVLYRLRSFIQDLFQQIQQESTSEPITVYLGQTIQRADLDNLENNSRTDDMLIFPQFLFGTTDYERAIRIAKELPLDSDDCIPLVIRIDISEDLKWANLTSHRYVNNEDENVLLNMGIMGRIVKVEKDEEQISLVHLRAVKAEEQRNFQQLLQTSRTEIKSFSSFVEMIKLMVLMNQQISVEQVIHTMYDDEILKSDGSFQSSIAASCHVLAQVRRDREDYQGALDLYLLSLNVFLRIISPKSVELSALYSNIGMMYSRLQNHDKSQEFYQLALDTQLHSNTPDLYTISSYTTSIGVIYTRQGKFPEAIKSLERTLKILDQCSEPHELELASTYEALANVYILQSKYDQALENYNKALEIHERLVPPSLQMLGELYQTTGNIYLKLGQSKEAIKMLKRALEVYQAILPLTHPTFALLYNNIGLMHYREEEYTDALTCYSKSLEISRISLPENHSLVGITLFNTALTYSSQEKFDEAIECIEKSTKQFLKTLPEDHPDVLENRKYLEAIRQKKILKDIFDENTISF